MEDRLRKKLMNLLVLLSSLIGYLEWGGNNSSFLFQVELEIISKLFTDPLAIVHPFTILPLLGQLLLFITLFQSEPAKILTYISIGGLGVLLGLMFLIGLIDLNFKIIISTVPFLMVSYLNIRFYNSRNSL